MVFQEMCIRREFFTNVWAGFRSSRKAVNFAVESSIFYDEGATTLLAVFAVLNGIDG